MCKNNEDAEGREKWSRGVKEVRELARLTATYSATAEPLVQQNLWSSCPTGLHQNIWAAGTADAGPETINEKGRSYAKEAKFAKEANLRRGVGGNAFRRGFQ